MTSSIFQGTLIYWHCISAPVLVVNLLLFSLFVKDLCFGIWSENKTPNTSTRQKQNNFQTTVKMFFTLGIPYICDLIAWSLLWAYGRRSLLIFSITSVLKAVNAAQGFIMFCVIFFDSKKIKSVYNKTISFTKSSSVIVHSMKNKKDVTCKSVNETRATYLKKGNEQDFNDRNFDNCVQTVNNGEDLIESIEETCFEMKTLK